MKAVELTVSQAGSWRKIAITLKTPVAGSKRVNAWLRQLMDVLTCDSQKED
jgi:hypothetical protein